ncbi:hypothetical protein [Sphingobium aromaticiconvertens]|uniref:hypothetical protein n=1 Tax=Sphingobium aromaticiconvertens TaxID=365341 RepID=UPI0030175A41
MSKTLRTVAVIAGAVALVAVTAGAAAGVLAPAMAGTATIAGVSTATVATIASAASAISLAASYGAQATAKKPPARGTVNQVIISADPPAPYIIGRTYSGGVLRHDAGYGATLKKVPNPYRAQVLEYSVAGPCQALENVYGDYAPIPFTGGAATGYYSNFLFRDVRRGLSSETALTPHWAGMPAWSSAHRLSSKATILLNGLFDKDGKRFASGWPATGAVWQGVMTYDARQDSTYPGGLGAQRINDEATWGYSEDPGQHALAYALGRYRNGKKVFGVGLPVDGIVLDHFVQLSNICAANGWTIGGVIYEPGDRWANLKRILEAGSAEPLFIGGKLGLRFNAPRVSIYELTAGDLTEDDAEIPAGKTWRERRNGIRPKYRSEANKWEYVPSDLVSIPAYIEEDGEEKFEELQWDLVQSKDQAAQLAAYRLVNGREIGPITLVCKPHLRRFGPGDMITLELGADHALGGLDAVILKRSVDPSTMKVTLTLETETPGKHDFALGRTGTAPPTPALVAKEDKDVIAASVIETDLVYQDGTPIDDLRPAGPGANYGAPGTSPVGNAEAQAVVDGMITTALTVAEDALRDATWRAEADKIIKLPGGGTLRTLSEQLGVTVDYVKTFVDFTRSVDTEGNAIWALTAQNSTGKVTGVRNLLTGEGLGTLQMAADILEIVDPDGGNARFILRYGLDNRLILNDVYIEKLEFGVVTRAAIGAGEVTDNATFTASDKTVTTTETTLIETPFFAIGDEFYGRGIAIVSFLQDGTANYDTSMRVRAYVDSGDGSGYVLIRDKIHGIDVDSGNARISMPVSFPLRIASIGNVRIKITATASLLAGRWGTTGSSAAREIAIDLFRGSR